MHAVDATKECKDAAFPFSMFSIYKIRKFHARQDQFTIIYTELYTECAWLNAGDHALPMVDYMHVHACTDLFWRCACK